MSDTSTGTAPTVVGADTMGWDSVFAVTAHKLNQAIVSRNEYPARLSFQQVADPDAFPPVVTELEADFGPWQICKGGSSGLIRFQTPMSNIRGKCTGYQQGEIIDFQVSDFTPLIEIRLELLGLVAGEIASSDKPPAQGTKRQKLVARTTTDTTKEAAVTLKTINWDVVHITPQQPETAALKNGLEPAFRAWFNKHLSEFKHIFTLLDLYDRADTGQWSFLKPHHASYAYVDRGSLDTSLLAMLCMTSDNPPPDQQEVSPFAIPDGAEAGFLLSAKRFFADMMLPMFEKFWKHSSPADFEVDADGLGISLKSGKRIQLENVPKGGKYTPYLTKFTIRLEHDVLRTDSYTETTISPGIVADCHSIHWNTIVLGEGKSGQTLKFIDVKEGSVDHDIKNSETIDEIDHWMGVAGMIGACMLIVIGGFMVLAVGGAILFLLTGLMPLTVYILDRVHHDDSPDIDMMMTNAVAPFEWTDSGDFKLSSAGLSNALQMGGTLE
ncbi:MAG: TULIP family P47-like protein [Planctomycetaceae bacterium]|nr:TULIP family P47-like protein [Planctomycetaceae bacterium]